MTAALSGRRLSKTLNRQVVLDAVDLEVLPGKAAVLIGPNGAGKSVALRALAMIDPPDSGEVTFEGRLYTFPTPSAPPPWPDVTVCFQQLFLWPHLKLRDAAKLVLQKRQVEGDRFDRLVEQLQLAHLLNRYPNECSLGERQRAALFRALVLRPKYLLADEVTAAMDVESAERVIEVLAGEMAAGVGIMLVTHHLGLATRLAASVQFVEGGRVIESGSADILRSPKTDRLRRFVQLLEPVTFSDRTA